MMPNHTKPFQIECDASKYASGAVLTQLPVDSNGDRHPCAFISKMFSPTEQNYEIYDRELLAIIGALEEWRHYIQGSPHTTIVFSDHKNLTYYRDALKLFRRQAIVFKFLVSSQTLSPFLNRIKVDFCCSVICVRASLCAANTSSGCEAQ
jgi:hypothetical protein